MVFWEAFLFGLLGGLLSQILIFKASNIINFKFVEFEVRALLWSILIAIIIGGCYTAFILEPSSIKQAILSGLTAEGCLLGAIEKIKHSRG